jgi:hypothetical protein
MRHPLHRARGPSAGGLIRLSDDAPGISHGSVAIPGSSRNNQARLPGDRTRETPNSEKRSRDGGLERVDSLDGWVCRVGQGLAPLASHRSGRAQLRHPAPRRAASLRVPVHDDRRRKPISLEQSVHRLECHVRIRGAATEPLAPSKANTRVEFLKSMCVPGDSEVRIVPSQLRREYPMLLDERSVPVFAAPLRHSAERCSKPALVGLAVHDPAPLARLPPVMVEAEQHALVTVPRRVERAFWLGFGRPTRRRSTLEQVQERSDSSHENVSVR